jgi:hypothetical protein
MAWCDVFVHMLVYVHMCDSTYLLSCEVGNAVRGDVGVVVYEYV